MTEKEIQSIYEALWAIYGPKWRQYIVTDPLTAPEGARVGDIVSYDDWQLFKSDAISRGHNVPKMLPRKH